MRLSNKNDIELVFKKGRSVYGKFFGQRWTVNKLKRSRFAVSIPTKVLKSSVQRNKLRRQIVKTVESILLSKTGFDILLTVKLRPGFGQTKQFLEEVRSLLDDIK